MGGHLGGVHLSLVMIAFLSISDAVDNTAYSSIEARRYKLCFCTLILYKNWGGWARRCIMPEISDAEKALQRKYELLRRKKLQVGQALSSKKYLNAKPYRYIDFHLVTEPVFAP